MNPKNLYFILWTYYFVTLGQAANSSSNSRTQSSISAVVDVDITAKNSVVEGCNDTTEEGSTASVPSSDTTSTVHTVSVEANGKGPIPKNAQKIVLKPNQPVLITVESGGGTPSTSHPSVLGINGLPLDIFGAAPEEKDNKSSPPPIIPQDVHPAAKFVEVSAGDQRILDLINQQPGLNNLTAEELNSQLGKYIDFLHELRSVNLHQSIKLPRLVFIGDNEMIKYGIIENIIGLKGALTPDSTALVLNPRFPAPIRFTLRNDPGMKELTFSIAGSLEWKPLKQSGDLFKALQETSVIKKSMSDFLMSEVAIEVEIRGESIPSLIFMDLPLKAPASNEAAKNEEILAKLLRKYLKQTWGVTVAVGNGNQMFDQWPTLSLMRTFDQDFKRTFPLAFDPPRGEDLRIEGIVMGLQEAFPVLKGGVNGNIFYLNDTGEDAELTARSFCKISRCGRAELIRGLQLRLLRTWNAMKMDILKTIQMAQEELRDRISGYDGYWALPDGEKKWTALLGQINPIIHKGIVFESPEEGTRSECTGSPLDLVRSSIFEKKHKQDIRVKSVSVWSNIFANYQKEISMLPLIPNSIDWNQIRGLLEELRAIGPNRHLIVKLKSILRGQLESLKVPKERLFEMIRMTWREVVNEGLEQKYSLEPFPEFKAFLMKSAEKLLKEKLEDLRSLDLKIEEADSISGWEYRYEEEVNNDSVNTTSNPHTAHTTHTHTHPHMSLWMELMKSNSGEEAEKILKRRAENGFMEICSRQAVLLPRLIISTLLTRNVVDSLSTSLVKEKDHLKLTEMTKESIDQLKKLEQTDKIMEQLKSKARGEDVTPHPLSFKITINYSLVLDVNLFREANGGNPELVRESQRKRGKSVEEVDLVISIDRAWVKLRFEVDELNKSAKFLQTKITEKMKKQDKEGAEVLVSARQQVLKEREGVEALMAEKEAELKGLLCNMGNIVHESVIASNDEAFNPIVRTHFKDGTAPAPMTVEEKAAKSILPHHQVLYRLDGFDAERGSKVSGHRGYFLKNIGVRLNQALINYGLDFLRERGYDLLQTPFLMRKEMMAKCAQLDDFDDQLYKVQNFTADGQDDSRYLIATSEQPIASFHADEWFDDPAVQLPKCYAGYSTCFRKEAGASGKDTWGLFRIHQFEKIEQFCITEPEKSWEMFEKMIGNSEDFYKSLDLSYRLVEIVGGALNNAAAKKYDLEAWFPNYGEYKELVSCSNCTDYQSRRLEIRCGLKKLGEREKKYVHCLNSTLSATERTLCCLLENYQTPEGLIIPEKLRPYLGGIEFVPYVRPVSL